MNSPNQITDAQLTELEKAVKLQEVIINLQMNYITH
jgi:hypothetical protein